MSTWVIDVEADGLYPTKFYCLVANHVVTNEEVVLSNHEDMKDFLLKRVKLVIGHNFTMWDVIQLERVLKIKTTFKIYDSLAISWYLYPTRKKHGLEDWGEEFGVPKPVINDWYNLSQEEYEHRCIEDVKINKLLWEKQKKLLRKIYKSDKELVRFLDYLAFKMDCVRAQIVSKWKLDIEMTSKALQELMLEREERFAQLSEAMPRVEHKELKMAPAKMYKKDGSLSAAGEKWINLCRFVGKPEDYPGPIEIVKKTEAGNPGSHSQIKDWLYSLGWKPTIIKYDRDKKTGELKEIPQVRDSKSGNICEHIMEISEEVPELKLLIGLSVIGHRIPMLNGFLKSVNEDGYVEASVQGLTNTLRFKHRNVVNLPKVDKPYGDKIRGALISPDGYELCGADMSSLDRGLYVVIHIEKVLNCWEPKSKDMAISR